MNPVANVILYQVIWFFCIRLGNLGALLSLPVLAAHLFFTDRRKADLRVMGSLLGAGLVIDGALTLAGFFTFYTTAFPIPFWLMIIWVGLATLVHHSLSWLKGRLVLCAVFGAFGGPLAYWAGVRMGAAAFNWGLLPSLFLLAVIWTVLWPLVMSLAAKDMNTKTSQKNPV